MKIVAIANVQVSGYGIVKRGSVIDFAKDKIDERIAANFLNAADDSRLAPAQKKDRDQPELLPKTKGEMLAQQDAERAEARESLLKKLGVEGIKEQLAELGVSFTSETPEKKLCDMLLDHLGE